MTLIIVTRL